MIIQASAIGMNSRRSYESTQAASANLATWGNKANASLSQAVGSLRNSISKDSQSGNGKNNFNNSLSNLLSRFEETRNIQSSRLSGSQSSIQKIRYHSMDYLLMLLFGDKYNLNDLSKYDSAYSDMSTGAIQEFGGSFSSDYYFHEEESTSFSTTGTVVTADGQNINFNLELTMSRSFTEAYSQNFTFGAPQMTDPLVINLDGNVANVSDQKFMFDLDADGNAEMISMLGKGSGFLALDKNQDGVINDGSELFGTTSGDGFSDLSKYDEDGNGWIDEADSIFNQLMIWTKDANGNDSLCGLGKAGVGAIYLGNASTDFSLNSSTDNSTNAAIRKTGIFLYENGGVGTVQHLDLAQ